MSLFNHSAFWNRKSSFWLTPENRFPGIFVRNSLAELYVLHSTRFYWTIQVSQFSMARPLWQHNGFLCWCCTLWNFSMGISVHDCLFFTEHFCKAKMKFCSSNNFSSLPPQVSNLCWIIAGIMDSMNLASILCSEVLLNSFGIVRVSFFHHKFCDHYAFNHNCNLFRSIVFSPWYAGARANVLWYSNLRSLMLLPFIATTFSDVAAWPPLFFTESQSICPSIRESFI